MGQECTTCLRGTPGFKTTQDLDLSKKVMGPIREVFAKLDRSHVSTSKEVDDPVSTIEFAKPQALPVQNQGNDSFDDRDEEQGKTKVQHKKFVGKISSKVAPDALKICKTLMVEFSNDFEAVLLPDRTIYLGEFDEEGSKTGEGLEVSPEGGVYKGTFRFGLKEGQSLLVFPNGDYFQGSFKKGQIEGKGKFVSKEGSTYSGQFKKDLKSGFGKEVWPDGSCYEGFYEEAQKHGHGKFTWKDGSVYEGDFVEDNIEGKGVYAWANGKRYDGEWKENKMHGFGVFFWPSGRKYEGQYKDDQKCGLGKLTYPDGRVYDGQWVGGQQHGQAYFTFLNKKTKKYITRKGRWEDGARVEWLKD